MRRILAFLFGLGLGLVAALTLAWGVLTPASTEIITEPANLKTESKELYTVLVAVSYAQDGDLDRAQKRLALLKDTDLRGTLTQLAERYIDELKPEAQRRSVAKLAVALGADSAALRVYVLT